MNEALAFWANIAQVISLPITVIALILQLITYLFPNPKTAILNKIITRVSPVLPFVIVAAVAFWLGTWFSNYQSASFTHTNTNTVFLDELAKEIYSLFSI